MMRILKRICSHACATIVIVILLTPVALWGKNLGTVGKTYPIIEKDALSELENRASRVDWKRIISAAKPEKYSPKDLLALPRSRKSVTRMVDMTYTLETDVVDTNGKVLYPKGYTFNPLDYLAFEKTIVVINGKDREQIEWFAKSTHNKKTATMLCITAGSATDLRKRLRRPVFYATSKILGKFAIRSVPSVVTRKGRMMEVAEVGFPFGWKQKEVSQ